MHKKYILEFGMWTDGKEEFTATEIEDCRNDLLKRAARHADEGYTEGYPTITMARSPVRSYWKIKEVAVEEGGPVGPDPVTCCCPYCSHIEAVENSAYGSAVKCSKCKQTFYIPYKEGNNE